MSARLKNEYIDLRTMSEPDLMDVYEIEQNGHLYPWSKKNLEDCINAAYTCRVAGQGGVVKGFSVMTMAVGEAHLLNVCVDSECQGQGIGQMLVSDVIELANKAACKVIFLEVRPSNQKAICLYDKNGFNQVGKRINYYPLGNGREDALIYALSMG